MQGSLRDAIVALSLSNLCFIYPWQVLLNPGHYSYYYWKNHPGFTEIIALALDVFLLAVLLWGGISITRRFVSGALARGARVLFLLILIIPVNSLRMGGTDLKDLNLLSFLSGTQVMISGCILLTAILLVFWRWSRKLAGIVVLILTILVPFFLTAVIQGIWLAETHRPDRNLFRNKTPGVEKTFARQSARRILCLVFDEMDQRMLFDARPAGTTFPEFDRFRSEAIYAAGAYPPAGETLMSMPALIVGRIVNRALPFRSDELLLTLDGSQAATGWSTLPNMFSAARKAGFRTALIGWYHPYGRVIGTDLDYCYWEPSISEANPVLDRLSIPAAMRLWARDVLFRIPLMFRLFKNRYMNGLREQHIVAHQRLLDQALAVVKKQDFDLALIHFPIPHHPFIQHQTHNSVSSTPENDYIGNLELADNVLGRLRREMEAANSWNRTAVLITSDHWWRESTPVNGKRDHRVPFMLKLAGQAAGMAYPRAFNTVLTHDLLLAYLGGALSTNEELAQWMDQHRSFGECSSTKNLP